MLSVTDSALQQLHDSLATRSKGNNSEKCFRIMPKDDRNLTLEYSIPADRDTTFDFKDRTVLAVPKDIEDIFSNKNLDVNDDGQLEIS